MADEVEPLPNTDLRTITGKARQVLSAERRVACARLLNKGYTLREVATDLGLTFGQVASVGRALVKESERQFAVEADKLRARLLQQNRVLQRELWDHLDRAKLGHIRQEIEEPLVVDSEQVASGAIGEKSSAVRRRRTIRENDLMAEARILETLRKTQADEAKILGWRPPDEPTPANTTNIEDNRSIIIINNADVPATSPWVASISPGIARQGVGVLPPGTTDAEAAAIVAEMVPVVQPGQPVK